MTIKPIQGSVDFANPGLLELRLVRSFGAGQLSPSQTASDRWMVPRTGDRCSDHNVAGMHTDLQRFVVRFHIALDWTVVLPPED
jgi:hypothetical protein